MTTSTVLTAESRRDAVGVAMEDDTDDDDVNLSLLSAA